MIPLAAIQAGTKVAGAGLGILARKLSREGQAEERQAADDADRLKRDSFGPSRAQKESVVADAVSQARQQAQAQRAEAARQRAASGSMMGGGSLNDQKIAATAAKTAGATRMDVEKQAAQQARQLKLDAIGRVRQRAEQTQADVAGLVGGAAEVIGEPEIPDLKDAYNSYNMTTKK